MTVPTRRRTFAIGSTSALGPATLPPVTSLWPFRYFVALCIARSTPSASGCWLMGLANVLSMTDSTPRARHAAAIFAMSTQRSVGLIGDSNQTRRVAADQHALGLGQLLDRHEPRLDAEARQQIVEQVQRPAVDRRAADDLVAGLHVRHQDRRRRALPRREQQRRLGAIERGQLPLDADDRRVRVARVQIFRRLALVVRGDLGGVLEDERRRLVDRRRQRHGVADVGLAGVNQLGGKSLLHNAPCPTRSPLAPTTGSMNWWYASS